jgi:aminopeptidase
MSTYIPSQEILTNYAKVLVNVAINHGQGVKAGDVVEVRFPDIAKPLGLAIRNEVLKAGAHAIVRMDPTDFAKDYYQLASDEQLTFFPKKYVKERINLIDHMIAIIADPDPEELKGVDPKKIMLSRDSYQPAMKWRTQKEDAGNFSWTLALWGVPAKAKAVGLSLEKYWDQIIAACLLDAKDPVKAWQEYFAFQHGLLEKLNTYVMESVHMTGEDVDLTIKLGKNRKWLGGRGANIPSAEFFTSPDWRGTNGWIRFNQPVYRYGSIMSGVYLRFEKGLVVEAKAKQGQELLDQMLKSPNANKLGEYSLTDNRLSKITHFMAETLYDENMGGPFGNTHVAVGMSYHDTYRGDTSKVARKDWEKMGFNESPEHTDIVSTTNRTVEATLVDGSKKVIYKDGRFQV